MVLGAEDEQRGEKREEEKFADTYLEYSDIDPT